MTNKEPVWAVACEDCLRNKYGYSFAVKDIIKTSHGNYGECPDCKEKDFLLEHSMFKNHPIR